MKQYDHAKIEKKWQKFWNEKGVYKTTNAGAKKKYYVLDMFPYPSGAGLHVGHPRGYIASDVFARMKRMQGFNVLHPMGFDSFGLPAEQYAIKTGNHPGKFTDQLVKRYKQQLQIIGFSYDWSREVATHRPEYYQWTQWIFLKLYNSWYDYTKNKARPIDELIAIFEKKGNQGLRAACNDETPVVSRDEWRSMSEVQQQALLMNYRLAYEGYSEVNWSPSLATVLANDEINPDGTAERDGLPIEKKMMRQWFMRITAYADRLLSDLEGLDWPSNIKDIQTNWIGKSEGSLLPFTLKIGDKARDIFVFTTRPDTLFGVTYVVLAPEHELVQEYKDKIQNWDEVAAYIANVKKVNEIERTNDKREKTGVQLNGITAINPANGEEVPVWIADYVLAQYGTGIVMAVPAHDERDFAFAKAFNLPICQVVISHSGEKYTAGKIRPVVKGIILKDQKVYLVKDGTPFHAEKQWTLPGGGIEVGESQIETLRREVIEEAGFTDFEIKDFVSGAQVFYVSPKDNSEALRIWSTYAVELNSNKQQEAELEGAWFSLEEAKKLLIEADNKFEADFIDQVINPRAFTEVGALINSANFTGLSSEEAKIKITEFVGGKRVVKYKLRDAVFARQRYWGEPIPLIHTKDGLIEMIPEKQLPLKLPNVKSYEPSGNGESPLASVPAWTKKGYETNTMPGWAGSSWYFLRYMDPHNNKAFAGEKALKYWKNVDMYVGGQEHATGHLLYSRFWHKFLYDLKLVPTKEPFQALRNQGMILAADGRKMSKRWGNVINPDEVVATYGADTLRLYEMFMGPFEATLPWSTENIMGCRRFLERVWRLQEKVTAKGKTPKEAERALHKCIKKVTEDIAGFGFNTAVSAMMIALNEFEKADSIARADYGMFLQILAPFAPHMTEDVWQNVLGNKKSINIAGWPKYSAAKAKDSTITMPVQVNGKVRATLAIPASANQADVERLALADLTVQKWIEGKTVRKVIYVQGRIINIVVSE